MSARLSFLFLLAACGGAQGGGEAASMNPSDFYPMSEGSVWSYDVDTHTGEPPVLAVLQVREVQGQTYTIANNGDEATRYELRPEGIWNADGEVWLLRAPLEVGQEWASLGGRRARIAALDESVETAMGTQEDCIRVDEAGGADGRTISTAYCRGLGMAHQHVVMRMDTGGEAVLDVVLRGYLSGPTL